MTPTTQILSDFICQLSPKDIPISAQEIAKKCILDLMASVIVGHRTDAARAVRDISLKLFSDGPCDVWFSDTRLQAPAAAFINSASASALDLDDGHRSAAGHPGASIIPACVALAQEVNAYAKELLTAIVIGYEVAIRVAAARDFAALDTLSTGRWCSYGVTAAGGWLRRWASGRLAEALSIAGVQSPGLSASGYSSVMGNHVKEGIPWSTFTGLCALELAAAGFTGPVDILDHPDYYDSEKIVAELGDGFAIEKVYFKPYACCRWIHSALDALCELMTENSLTAAEIKKVQVYTFQRALRLNNYPNPDSLESAQYSIPFCLAVAALEGKKALLLLRSDLLGRPDLVAFARKVELSADSMLDKSFPVKIPARVILKTARGSFQMLTEYPIGDPANPLDFDGIIEKFQYLSHPHMSSQKQEEMVKAITSIEKGGLGQFYHLLRREL